MKKSEIRVIGVLFQINFNLFFINNFKQKCIREAFKKKKIAEKETLVHVGGRGIKKSPFFSSPKRGHILMEGGVKIFCHMSHVHFGVSVSTQFVAFFEALHNVNFLYHLTKYLT